MSDGENSDIVGLPNGDISEGDDESEKEEDYSIGTKYDDLPEQAFYLVGDITEAIKKAEKLKE